MPDPTPTTLSEANTAKTDANTAKQNATTHKNNWYAEKNSMIEWLRTNVAGDANNHGASVFDAPLTNLDNILANDSFAHGVAKNYLADAKSHLQKLALDGGATTTMHNPASTYASGGNESDNTNVSLPALLNWTYTPQSNNSGSGSSGGSSGGT